MSIISGQSALTVIAEGVETEEQARVLRLFRCDEMQGYLISRPIPAQELVALLATENVSLAGLVIANSVA